MEKANNNDSGKFKKGKHNPRVMNSPECVSFCVVALHQCEPDAGQPTVPCSVSLFPGHLQKPLYSHSLQNWTSGTKGVCSGLAL